MEVPPPVRCRPGQHMTSVEDGWGAPGDDGRPHGGHGPASDECTSRTRSFQSPGITASFAFGWTTGTADGDGLLGALSSLAGMASLIIAIAMIIAVVRC